MRKIKFRAWHKEEKIMCQVDNLNSNGAFLIGVKKGEDQYGDKWYVYAPDNGRFCQNEEIELMQFTGLKDKQGKEIYESDIIKISNWKNPVLSTCIWEAGQFNLIDNAGGYWTRQLYHQPERLEMIGNIYENPKLF